LKKLLLASLLMGSSLFALTTDQKFDLILNKLDGINTKVNKIETRVNKLEEKVNKTQKAQKEIEEKQSKISNKVESSMVVNCGKLKIVDFNYQYSTFGLEKGYKFTFKIKNNYKKAISHINSMIAFIDKDDETLVQEHLIKDVNIAPNQATEVKDTYFINDDLAGYLATTPKKDIHLEVKPLFIKFNDGSIIRCSRW